MKELYKMLKDACIEAFDPKAKEIDNEIQEIIKIGYSLNYWDNFNLSIYNKIRQLHGKTPL